MAKMYGKEELKYEQGYLVDDDGNIVFTDPKVVNQANLLETLVQQHKYLEAQPKAVAMPSLDGFERKSIFENDTTFTVDTPLHDAKVKNDLEFMEECDAMCATDAMNKMAKEFIELIRFATSKKIIGVDGPATAVFNTPTLGNPLTWTEDIIADAIASIHGCGVKSYE